MFDLYLSFFISVPIFKIRQLPLWLSSSVHLYPEYPCKTSQKSYTYTVLRSVYHPLILTTMTASQRVWSRCCYGKNASPVTVKRCGFTWGTITPNLSPIRCSLRCLLEQVVPTRTAPTTTIRWAVIWDQFLDYKIIIWNTARLWPGVNRF